MSILGSSWREAGYYEDDGYEYTKVDDPQKIRELKGEGRLYIHDGMSMSKVNKCDIITIKHGKYSEEQI